MINNKIKNFEISQEKILMQKLIDYMEENFYLTDESRYVFKKALEEIKYLIEIKTTTESLNVSEAVFLYRLLSQYYNNDKGPENFINAFLEAKQKTLLYLIFNCENIEILRNYTNELMGVNWNEYEY